MLEERPHWRVGSSTTNLDPQPSASSTQQVPPCIPVSSFTIASPIPVPATADSRSSRQAPEPFPHPVPVGRIDPWSAVAHADARATINRTNAYRDDLALVSIFHPRCPAG